MKCRAPVEPVDFCRRICQNVLTRGQSGAKARYLNRLTPMSVIVKATESGLEEGARRALVEHFKLRPKETASAGSEARQGPANERVESETDFATVSISTQMMHDHF